MAEYVPSFNLVKKLLFQRQTKVFGLLPRLGKINGRRNGTMHRLFRWNVTGKGLQAFLPGIVYFGNPSGTKNTPNCVGSYSLFDHWWSMGVEACL
ncbi:MAG: hypothetical protein PHS04_14490 [Tissierellia bacterium]|jgi:hypothetical protein|nr:hypothetical protein [Dysgonamonadaceae bacterium]MDD4439219.1 hypothetical protein [Tissierellia bacterium]